MVTHFSFRDSSGKSKGKWNTNSHNCILWFWFVLKYFAASIYLTMKERREGWRDVKGGWWKGWLLKYPTIYFVHCVSVWVIEENWIKGLTFEIPYYLLCSLCKWRRIESKTGTYFVNSLHYVQYHWTSSNEMTWPFEKYAVVGLWWELCLKEKMEKGRWKASSITLVDK